MLVDVSIVRVVWTGFDERPNTVVRVSGPRSKAKNFDAYLCQRQSEMRQIKTGRTLWASGVQ